MRRVTGVTIAAAAACALTAVVVANVPVAGHSAPTTIKKAKAPSAGISPVSAVPYYVAIDQRSGAATVRRTATGAKIATVRPPHGAAFGGVAAAGDDRTFVLVAQTSSTSRFYRLRLSGKGQPGRLALTAVRPLPTRFGSCPVSLAGLAVSPDGRLLAASVLSNCPTGRAGPSEILTARLGTGRTLATFHPGDGYPMWLSWTTAGSLAYSWTGAELDVFIIRNATKPGASPRLLIKGTTSVRGFDDANYPLITPDGSTVIATVGRGSFTFALAEFAAGGKARRLLTPPVRSPAQFCGPLWTSASGAGLLTGCGDNSEYEIQNGHLTKLHSPWQLPTYNVPGAPAIAW